MKVAVYGNGTMGRGIVQVLAQKGYQTVLLGRRQTSLDAAKSKLESGLQRLVTKEKITAQQMEQTMSNITISLDMNDVKDCDIVIEAIAEDLELKKEILAKLDEVCAPNTILATNTSSLSITELASATKRPEKVIGMHFFNPVPVMKLIEVIKGQLTSKETYDTVYELSVAIGKTPVPVEEAPGFVVNRILIPMINEAIGALADGVATAEEIDTAMKLGASHPMGPLTLGDFIGLDVCLAIMEVLHREFGDDKYRPHPLLRKMVRAGLLGRKTSRGFFQY